MSVIPGLEVLWVLNRIVESGHSGLVAGLCGLVAYCLLYVNISLPFSLDSSGLYREGVLDFCQRPLLHLMQNHAVPAFEPAYVVIYIY